MGDNTSNRQTKRAISAERLVWIILIITCFFLGMGTDYLVHRGKENPFRILKSETQADDGITQLTLTTLSRKSETMAVPIYSLSLRDIRSGNEFPLVTAEDTFQEPTIAPILISRNSSEAIFSVGKGKVRILLPQVSIEGTADETIYRGAPRE